MPRVVLTGGPGAGKTALLAELGARGYATVAESAREIIQDRKALGLSPRPGPLQFAQEILRRDSAKYPSYAEPAQWVFFDRSVIEAIGMVHEVAPFAPGELDSQLAAYRMHTVYVLPPWEAIYATDAERDQSFIEAVAVHGKVVQWYSKCGYAPREVPRVSVPERAEHVLRTLAQSAA